MIELAACLFVIIAVGGLVVFAFPVLAFMAKWLGVLFLLGSLALLITIGPGKISPALAIALAVAITILVINGVKKS